MDMPPPPPQVARSRRANRRRQQSLTALWLVLLVLLVVVVRPRGDHLLWDLTGGSDTAAFQLGLGIWVLPLALAGVWVRSTQSQLASGVCKEDMQGPRGIGLAFVLSSLPLGAVPLLVSRHGADTPLEQSVVFTPFLIGVCCGIAVMLILLAPLSVYAKRAEAARQRQSRTP
jgi:uncharacterized membrane protein (DUF485 family)